MQIDQEKIIKMLNTYAEEWGEDNVVVYLPRDWEQHQDALGFKSKVRFFFNTRDEISICAVGQDNQVLCGYTAALVD